MAPSSDGGRTIDRLTDPWDAEDRWRSLAAVGGVFIVIGLLVLVFPLVFGTAIRLIIGGGFLVTGVPLVWRAVRSKRFIRAFAVEFVLGVFYLGAGLVLLTETGSVVRLVAIFVVVAGLILVFFGVRQRPRPGWVFPAGAGCASVALGVLIWVGWPNSEPETVGVLAGLALVTTGAALIALVQRVRREKATAELA